MTDNTLLPVLLGLTTAASWGVSNFFAASSSKNAGAVTTAFYVNLINLVVYGLLFVLFLEPSGPLLSSGAAFAGAGGIIIVAGLLFFFSGFVAGPVSLVAPITAAYPLVSTILALLVFGASLSAQQLTAIAIIIIGVMATAGLFNIKKKERHLTRGPMLAICAAVVYGIGFACVAQGVERIGWQTAGLAQLIAATAVFVAIVPLVQRKERVFASFKKSIANKHILIAALIGLLGMLALNLGFSMQQASGGAVVIAVSACYPIITILLALKHFGEEFKLVPMLGACASIVGIVALSLG